MTHKVKQDGRKWHIESRTKTGWKVSAEQYRSKKDATKVIIKLYAVDHGSFPSGKKK